MTSIETKYCGPTNYKGSRVIADAGDGRRVTIQYNDELNSEAAHAEAAMALCKKMKWTGELVEGATRRGYVFVFAEGERYKV